jgi:hypothetical protein
VQLRRQGSTEDRFPPGAMQVELIDGSLLLAREFRVEKNRATIAVFGDNSISVPTASIASVRFYEQSAKIAEEWADIVGTQRTGDTLVLRKAGAIDYLTGVIGDVTNDAVHFETDGEKFEVKRTRVEGLLYAASRRAKLSDAVCAVTDIIGTRFEARTLGLVDNTLEVVTPAGISATIPLDRLQRIDFKVEYLSDLKPESIEQLPYLAIPQASPSVESRFHRPRFNAALETGTLRLGGVTYAKGLSMYSRTEIVYRLPEKYGRLEAVAGLDASESAPGSVRLVVSGDDRVLLDRVIEGSEIVPLNVDVGGVRRLKILVDFNGDEVSDRLNICQPRLVR